MIERTRVSRHDWLHGLAACPNCGLPLDPDRDPNEEAADGKGVSVTHTRCGAEFELEFTE